MASELVHALFFRPQCIVPNNGLTSNETKSRLTVAVDGHNGRGTAGVFGSFLLAARVPYFPTMCETSFSFSMQMYSISSVPVTNCQVTFTVQGLV